MPCQSDKHDHCSLQETQDMLMWLNPWVAADINISLWGNVRLGYLLAHFRNAWRRWLIPPQPPPSTNTRSWRLCASPDARHLDADWGPSSLDCFSYTERATCRSHRQHLSIKSIVWSVKLSIPQTALLGTPVSYRILMCYLKKTVFKVHGVEKIYFKVRKYYFKVKQVSLTC